MASSRKSEKLGLSLWEATDKPERADFVADNEKLEELVGRHITDKTIHPTAEEMSFVQSPFTVYSYLGNGSAERNFTIGGDSQFFFTFCQEKPAFEVDGDGRLHTYWDYTGSGKGQISCGGGGVEVKSQRYYCYSKEGPDRTWHMNDQGYHYTILRLPKIY